jgi:hypothetical protein
MTSQAKYILPIPSDTPPPPITCLKPYSLYVCVDECLLNIIVCLIKYFILTYTASCDNRTFAENAPKLLTKIHQT